jgi:aminocarboxymuconate-semialdehyde decarboxylase
MAEKAGMFRFFFSHFIFQIKEEKMIIDAHTHMFHESCLEAFTRMGGHWAQQKVARLSDTIQKKPSIANVQERLGFLDRNGIDMQIVTPPHHIYSSLMPDDIATQSAVIRVINDGMGRLMEASKGRLIAAGTVPLEEFDKYGQDELERAVNKLGLKAVCVASHWWGKPLDSPEFVSFWAQAAEMEIPVYIHPADPVGFSDRPYERDYDLAHTFGWPFETILTLSRLVFSGILDRYPTLKIVSHHLGGGVPFFLGRIMETYVPEKQQEALGKTLQKPLDEYFSLFYYDTAVGGSASAIKCAYDVLGADKLLFATDAPFGPGSGENRLAEYPKIIESLGLSEAEKNKIFAGNVREIFKL